MNQFLEAILDGMLEGIVAIDSDTKVALYNRAAARMFRLPAVAQGPALRLIEVTRDPEINDAFRTVLRTGVADVRRVEILRSDRRVFELHINPIGRDPIAGTTEGAAGIFFDITDLERLERVRRDFFANLSHELRTPLTAILAYIETLLDGAIDDPENRLRFLEVVHKHAVRMQNLVRDMTDLSLIESGKVVLRATETDLAQIVDEVLVLTAGRAEATKVTVSNTVPRGFRLEADRNRLEQILHNLIDNAVKFNVQGGKVEISAERTGEGATLIRVRDTGPGMPQADLSRIFERFYRADRSRSREVGGSGLGLAIVKHLVLMHGGTVSVESRQGKGSTFLVALPPGSH